MSKRKYLFTVLFTVTLFDFKINAKDTSCSFPGSPAHSLVTFSNNSLISGTVASYSCERGFELLGPGRRVCDSGNWIPEGIPFCVLNVAAGKAPMQISTEELGIPQKAIDGSTSAFFSTETCSLTKIERFPWWYVNLLEPYMVQLVRLDFGKLCCGNSKTATIIVRVGNNRPDLGTNPICNRFTGILEEGQPLFLPCNPPMPGAFVSVHVEVDRPSSLSICEAFVYTDQALPIERCPTFRDQPPGASASYNGKCYTFYNRQPLNFKDALSFCRSRGGTLINESNPALQGFISWELWRRHRSDLSSQYWLGAIRDSDNKNIWKWVDGEEVTVSFWSHPSSGDNACTRYDGSKGWLWSDTNCNTSLNFICQHHPKACGRPEQPPNSTILAPLGFAVGANIEYTCDDGHLLIGPSLRTCLETGFYNEFPPVCKNIECGLPALIPHGRYDLINGSVGYLSIVIYKCEEGYEMVGRALLACDIDERWNGPPPRCEVIECSDLPGNYYNTIIHASNGTLIGSEVEISCPTGYRLEGPKVITCLSTGHWNSLFPKCINAEHSTLLPPTTLNKQRIKSNTKSTTQRISDKDNVHTQSTIIIPGTVREEFPTKKTIIPNYGNTRITTDTSHKVRTSYPIHETSTKYSQNILLNNHPQENEIVENVLVKQQYPANINIPYVVNNNSKEIHSAKLNFGVIVALAAFGGFIFLAAVITAIVILVKRGRVAQHYRHRASPDCNTVASFDSSTSGSRNGLNRYYRQAWENLHESASKGSSNNPLRRKGTLDPPIISRSNDNLHRSRDNLERSTRDFGRNSLGIADGNEIIVSDVCNKGERKRHHHHHHHHKTNNRSDFRDQSVGANTRRQHHHHGDHY